MTSLQIVKDLYVALERGDIEKVLELFDPQVAWHEAEGNPMEPSGTPWIGVQTVLNNMSQRIMATWDGLTMSGRQFYDAGDTIVVEGRYHATHKATGKKMDTPFCHIWKVRDGRVVNFQQYTDTAAQQAIAGKPFE